MERGKTISASRWPVWLNAAGLLIVSWVATAARSLHIHRGSKTVAVVFPPSWSAQPIFLAAAPANAAIVRMTAFSSLLVVRPDDHGGLARLRKTGVWLTIDPQATAACFAKQSV